MLYAEHGGYVASDRILLDFSVNTNPYGMPQSVREAVIRAAQLGECYPDITSRRLREEICGYERTHYRGEENLLPEQILPGNGASELIMALAHAYPKAHVLLQAPLFSGYERAFRAAGADILYTQTGPGYTLSKHTPNQILDSKPDIAVLCHPGNPTGAMIPDELLRQITQACIRTGTLLAVDECFLPFVDAYRERSSARFLQTGCELVILRAFTKLYAMPGIRLGYAVCSDQETADRISCHLPEWNVSVQAQEAGLAALREESYVTKTTLRIRAERSRLKDALETLGLRTVPGEANFIFLYSGTELYEPLLRRGILIRRCCNYHGIPEKGYYRIAVRRREENDRLLETLVQILQGKDTAAEKIRQGRETGTEEMAKYENVDDPPCRDGV